MNSRLVVAKCWGPASKVLKFHHFDNSGICDLHDGNFVVSIDAAKGNWMPLVCWLKDNASGPWGVDAYKGDYTTYNILTRDREDALMLYMRFA